MNAPKISSLSAGLILLRPHHWVKNLLLALPMVAARKFTGIEIMHLAAGMACFSLAASAGYIFNDLLDTIADKNHPVKQNRPLAKGVISNGAAIAVAVLLALVSISAAFLTISSQFAMTVGGYLAVSALYSYYIKRLLILDVIVLAGLYCLRIFAGALAVEVTVSSWLMAFGLFFFLQLALLKRYIELADSLAKSPSGMNTSRRAYRAEDLSMLGFAGPALGYLSILVLALYIESPVVDERYGHPGVLWCLCPLLFYWITRIWVLANRKALHSDPVVFALTDKASWLTAFLTILTLYAGG